MSLLDQVAEGLAIRLQTIAGLNVAQYFFGSITPPSAVIGVSAIPDYHLAMGRNPLISLEPTIHLFTGAANDIEGQRALADFASPTGERSIRAAIEADRTLDGVVSDMIVKEFRPLNLEEYAALSYFGGVFTLQGQARSS